MAIKMLVNPFEDPTSNPKHEVGIVVSDPRGNSGIKTYQQVLPGEGTGTSGYPTAVTFRFNNGYSPDAEYQYVRNADTDSIIAGSAVMLSLGATDENGAVEYLVSNRRVAGVAVRTIPAGFYGWIQVSGKVPVPSTTTNSDAEKRGGVRVSTDIATDSLLGGSATDGVMVAVATDTNVTAQILAVLSSRRIVTIDTGVNLATTGGTDYRCEAVIYP
jgi:predicted RecA/RadA family phage recombinase